MKYRCCIKTLLKRIIVTASSIRMLSSSSLESIKTPMISVLPLLEMQLVALSIKSSTSEKCHNCLGLNINSRVFAINSSGESHKSTKTK